jgi:protein phosphatase
MVATSETLSSVPPPTPAAVDPPKPFSSLVEVDLAGRSHPGKVRPNNEDHFLIGKAGRFFDVAATNLPPDDIPDRSDETGYGMVVADGMGGYKGGEIASRLAIRTLINLVLHVPDWILRPDDAWGTEILKRMSLRLREVDLEIARQAEKDPTLSRMGTTLTLGYSIGSELFVAHVGDSRAYLFRRGKLCQLTHDQTLGQSLVDMGVMSREEAATNRLRHALTQALGKQGGKVRAEVHRLKLTDGDTLLLCTDGLTEMVAEPRIAEVLAKPTTSDDACKRLVDLALDGGGRDNITVIVAQYRLPTSSAGS